MCIDMHIIDSIQSNVTCTYDVHIEEIRKYVCHGLYDSVMANFIIPTWEEEISLSYAREDQSF